jgi:hypothetical protein
VQKRLFEFRQKFRLHGYKDQNNMHRDRRVKSASFRRVRLAGTGLGGTRPTR